MHIGKNWAKQGISEVCFVPKTAWSGSGGTPRKICNVYPHLRLETVFPALKQSQNYYANMKIGNFQSQVSISSMDWEILRSTARVTFRNPKFKISLWIKKKLGVKP